MEDTGFSKFPGNLDPRAQEFIPTTFFPTLPLLSQTLYYPYPSTSSPPPPPPPPQTYSPHHHPSFPPQPVYDSTDYHHPPFVPCFTTSPPPPSLTVASRSLLVSMVPLDVSESVIRRDLEVFGDVRAVQMERLRREGIVTVHFYDIRQARRALVEIQEQNMHQQYRLRCHYDELATRNSIPFGFNFPPPPPVPPFPPVPPPAPGLIAGRAVWAQFTVPFASSMPDGKNQGTLIIFNLDPEVPSAHLKQIFQAFGHVRELRETPTRKNHRFVEFYDVRDAAVAMSEMNGKEIHGKKIMIHYSRPGGQCKKLSDAFRNASRVMPRSPPTPPPLSPVFVAGNLGRRSSSSSSSSNNNDVHGIEEFGVSRPSKDCPKNVNNNNNNNPSTSSKPRQQRPKNFNAPTRPWKSKEFDSRYLIDEEAILESNCTDSRTTLMIKNIPNKYSLKIFLNLLDVHCVSCNEQIGDGDDQPLSSYDFVYLPIDFMNKCNVGYGFVNMTSPEATWRLYKAFHHQNWQVFNSRKICEVTYARLQGIETLKEHFKNSRFLCEADEYMPVMFSPPRDGRQLTEPVPIVGRLITSSPQLLSSASGASSSKDKSEGITGELEEVEFMGKINIGGGGGYEDLDGCGGDDSGQYYI